MKKKINSIDYGWKIICIGLVIGVVVPLIIYGVNRVMDSTILMILVKCCIGSGMLIIAGFFICLGIELRQDKKIARYYDNHRKDKIKISQGHYECASCGNRKVTEQDISCSICGVVFEENNKTVSEILMRS